MGKISKFFEMQSFSLKLFEKTASLTEDGKKYNNLLSILRNFAKKWQI